jgi:hypothetical protein
MLLDATFRSVVIWRLSPTPSPGFAIANIAIRIELIERAHPERVGQGEVGDRAAPIKVTDIRTRTREGAGFLFA